jgi:hypothetical protein
MLKTIQDSSNSVGIIKKINWTWVHTFVLMQFTLQILLLFPQFGIFRVVMRSASFTLSLFLLVRLGYNKGSKHPATRSAIWVLVILLLQLCLHPHLNSFMAAMAQCAMYASILAPLFWVRRLKITMNGFSSLIFFLWIFQTLSATLGVLQVYYPGQFQPFLSTSVQQGIYGGDNLLITLANGELVYRPMGLTDVPGGAATAGLYTLLFGVGIALKYPNPVLRVVCVTSAAVGLLCIYLCQVRSVLVVAAICMLCLAVVLLWTGQLRRLTLMTSSVIALFTSSFSWAIAIGGKSTLERITSLFAANPESVYQENRGKFLQSTLENLLPEYPLGAGLGRWGMINNYFGDNTDLLSRPIWVEIQWTGWLVDGGLPLIFAYTATLYFACHTAWKIAISKQVGDFAFWGGLICAYNVGTVAVTFNYPIFNSQGGMEFWLLNAALFAAYSHSQKSDYKSTERICP